MCVRNRFLSARTTAFVFCALATLSPASIAQESPSPAGKPVGTADAGTTPRTAKDAGIPNKAPVAAPERTPEKPPESAPEKAAPTEPAPRPTAAPERAAPEKTPEKAKGTKGKGRGKTAPAEPSDSVDDGGLDAGPAEPVDANAVAPTPDAGPKKVDEGSAITFHGNDSPVVFRVGTAERTREERAAKGTELLTRALDGAGELDEPPLPSVVNERGVGAIRVGKSLIATVYPADADAEDMAFDRYLEHLDSQMKSWVPAQLRRRAVQLFALHVFLSIFFGVLGFLTLRFLRNAFNRWEIEFDERRGSLPAVSILRIPIFSSEAVGGAVAFGLAVGRVLAYVVVVISTLAAVLSQFDFTRPLLRRLVSWSGGPLLNGLELVITSIPGVIFAAVLIVALRAALRVFNLLLDGVSKKRIVWNPLPPQKVPVFRFAVTALVILLVLPLLVAAAFGRFGTPLEYLALGAGGAVIIASIPMIASYVVGIRLLWREGIHAGDWVQVGDVAGEVTSCGLSEISLVPEGGGIIIVPMLFLVFHPLRRLRSAPAVNFELTVARDRPVNELLTAITTTVQSAESDARVELVDVCHAWVKVNVSAPAVRDGVRQTLLVAVSHAVDEHLFELPTIHGPDRY